MLLFKLSRPAVVRFTVVRVSPSCERVGSFRVRAHAGVNRVRFRGRLRGKPLAEGTYRLVVRARGAGADAAAVTIVVDRGRPLGPAELRAARDANVCGVRSAVDGETAESRGAAAPSPRPPGERNQQPDRAEDTLGGAVGAVGRKGKILGARFIRAVEDPTSVHPLVWAALVLSILLLMLASVPTTALANTRATVPLAYHRFEIALAGTATLGTAFLVYLIS